MGSLTRALVAFAALAISCFIVEQTQIEPVFGQEQSAEPAELNDPLETVNRGIFWFNERLDLNIIEPVSREYHDDVPKPVRTGVKNFFQNLGTPIYLVSDVLQLKFEEAGTHLSRFLINSTIGVAGFIDVAKEWGLEHRQEDLGIALGYDGVPAGPYLVLPILGPSNVRDLFGRVADAFLTPTYYLGATGLNSTEAWIIGGSLSTVELIDARSRLLQATDYGRENSFDYYTFIQSSYTQSREGLIQRGKAPEKEENESQATPNVQGVERAP